MNLIQILSYETGNMEKISLSLRGIQQKVNKTKSLIICADISGSMMCSIDDSSFSNLSLQSLQPLPIIPEDEDQEEDEHNLSPPKPILRHSMTAATPSLWVSPSQSSLSSQSNQNKNTRLECVHGVLMRIIDMCQYLLDTQEYHQELSIILFDDKCLSFSTMDGLTFEQIKKGVIDNIYKNGGTNFVNPLQKVVEYKEKLDSDVIFLSDGSHCSVEMNCDQIAETFKECVDLAIGIGNIGQADFDEKTLRSISKEFVIGTDAKRIRDLIADRVFGIVTLLGKELKIHPHEKESVFLSNMIEKDGDYTWPEMSMLMELYLVVKPDAIIDFSYILKDGRQIIETLQFTGDNTSSDSAYGDKIVFCLETLSRLENLNFEKYQTPKQKLDYINELKENVVNSQSFSNFKETRLGVYFNELYHRIESMLLTKDEKHLLHLVNNVKSEALQSTTSTSASAFCSPSLSQTPSLASTPSIVKAQGGWGMYNSKCMICLLDTANREVVYHPCGHFMTCSTCSIEWNKTSDTCPYCNQKVTGCILVNLSEEQQKDSWNMKCLTCKKRPIQIVSTECKHVFSCKRCVEEELKNNGNLTCKVCNGHVTKFAKVFM